MPHPALFYWRHPSLKLTNFGDFLSRVLVEKILGHPPLIARTPVDENPRLLAIGSILHYAKNGDIIWGAGVNGNHPSSWDYKFSDLQIRAVRGPLTRNFVLKTLKMECPEIYGDPALLLPRFFPDYRRLPPETDHIIIPHISDKPFLSKQPGVVFYPDEDPWTVILEAMLKTRLVIASSLHGLIVAEAFGIPARMLRISARESLFKFEDYYLGSGRSRFGYAESLQEAVTMGGEEPVRCDLQPLLEAFPYEAYEEPATEAHQGAAPGHSISV